MANPIRKTKTLAGTVVWQVDGRKYGASPARPQFPTKEQAEDALAEMIAKRGGDLRHGRREITFAQQTEAFLAHAESGLANKTLRGYKNLLNNHVLPHFGSKRVVDISTSMIKAFLNEKRAPVRTIKIVGCRGRYRNMPLAEFDPSTMKDGGVPPFDLRLSNSTIRLIRATLSVVLGSAVEDKLIERNPVADAKAVAGHGRKARAEAKVAVPKERPFSTEQQTALLNWCLERDGELHDFLFLMFRLGVRPGEARALRWGDLVGRKMLIERSASDRDEITPTKTGSVRSVDISDALADVLRFRRLKKRPDAKVEDYMFGNGERPIDARVLARRFETAMSECKITGHSLYDLRHTFASVLYQRCRDIVYVAKQLGHSDPSTTLKYYAHFVGDTTEPYVNLLDNEPAAEREREEMKAST